MKRVLLAISLVCAASMACAQSFPLGGAFIFSPKTGKTIAAAEIDDARGYLPSFPIPFTKLKLDLTPFAYAGVQLGGNSAAGGVGLKWVKVTQSATYHIGGSYGFVAGDNSPHFGLVFGVMLNLTPKPQTAKVHEFVIR